MMEQMRTGHLVRTHASSQAGKGRAVGNGFNTNKQELRSKWLRGLEYAHQPVGTS